MRIVDLIESTLFQSLDCLVFLIQFKRANLSYNKSNTSKRLIQQKLYEKTCQKQKPSNCFRH